MGGPDPERNSRTKFSKRCKTLRTKAHELAKLCDANVYLLIDHPRGSYAYNSADDNSWPPPDEVLVGKPKQHTGRQAKDNQGLHYPKLRRQNFSEMERSLGSSDNDLKRLLKYFATRGELLQSFLGIYEKRVGPASEATERAEMDIIPDGHNKNCL